MHEEKIQELNLSGDEGKREERQMGDNDYDDGEYRRMENVNDNDDHDNDHEQRQRSRQKPHSRVMTAVAPTATAKHQKLTTGQLHYSQYLQKQQQFHQNQQVLRSFLRIQQGRQQPIDKFVKILYIYKGKYEYESRLHDIMVQPKKYLNKLTLGQLEGMVVPTKRHLTWEEKMTDDRWVRYWANLLKLIQYKIAKKQQHQHQQQQQQQQTFPEQNIDLQKFQIKQKVKSMLNKSPQQLNKLTRKIELMIKNTSFSGSDLSYWRSIGAKIKGKLYEQQLRRYYAEYKESHLNQIQQRVAVEEGDEEVREPISPVLQPLTVQNVKYAVTAEQELEERVRLNQAIFREEFEKHKEKLENNLSLPKNHNLLSKDFVTQSTKTYDLITQQIMQFQKYRRMQEDEQEFDDWLPVQTEGMFRDRKPEYINRVRITHDWTRYGQSGIIKQRYDAKQQPPPKQVQGYKFNIFYPDLFDKQKTPQYYFEPLQDPSYMMIKFKAGPPYKDIAFKILRKQWDYTEKSGFEAIFTKGILQLYFNFKKPKFRI